MFVTETGKQVMIGGSIGSSKAAAVPNAPQQTRYGVGFMT